MDTKICAICGKEFTTKFHRRKICYDVHIHPCPICGKDVVTDMHHINNCCCKEHSRILASRTIKERYEIHPCHSEEAKKKREQTNLMRFGVKNPFQSEQIKDKIKSTLKQRYGVDNPSKSEDIIAKRKRTNVERYGGNAPACSDRIIQKIYDTIYKKYGIIAKSTLCVPEVKEKCRQTTLERYGVENYMQNPVSNFQHMLNRKYFGMWELSEKKCKLCGKTFMPRTLRQTYCDDIHTSKCKICGKEFVVNNKYHIPNTCSMRCNRNLAIYGVFMSD